MDKSLILEKIKEYKKFKSNVDFADFLGVSPQLISKWGSRNTFDIDILYSRLPELSPDWLLTGAGSMLRTDSQLVTEFSTAPPAGGTLIPLYDGVITAGMMQTADMATVGQPAEMVNAGDWFRDATAAMRVHGDSMHPNYPSGCIVALKVVGNKRLVIYGQDYVIETEEYRTLKRIQRSVEQTCWLACSTNTEMWEQGELTGRLIHEPFDVHIDDVRMLYLVLGVVRRNHSSRIVYNQCVSTL